MKSPSNWALANSRSADGFANRSQRSSASGFLPRSNRFGGVTGMGDFVTKTKNGNAVLTERQTHFFAAAIYPDVRAFIDSNKIAFEKWKIEVGENEKV